MKYSNRIRIASLAGLIGTVLALPVHAGGPLANCSSGEAFVWPNGGTNITFNPDQGDLGPVDGPDAIALVADAFSAWQDIPTATLSYVAGEQLPVDVDINNFAPYLNAPAPDGLSAVVFDDTGEIFNLLYGADSGILGFAGPEWLNGANCTILEGLSFLNGPSFDDATAALDVMVHEFGHWTNFAHTVVNGQVYLGSIGGDNTGPTPFDTFGLPPNPFSNDVVETMYPFYYGPGIGTASLERDDIAIASRMYPEPGYAASTGEISGTILLDTQKITGVNVIARNVDDPFNDAASAISSDFTDSTDQADPNVGVYRITGLTPGAQYGVYIDEVRAGGFSTALASPLPGPEELYNGAMESGDASIDIPSDYVPVGAIAGVPTSGIDILINEFVAGDPLPVGDEGAVLLGLPFDYGICGQDFNSVYVNANGSLTFGAAATAPDFIVSAQGFLDGPPRIAGLWADLDSTNQGSVFFTQTNNTFTVTWDNVPEWSTTNSNTFSVTLKKGASQATVEYGDLDAENGIAGVSCGLVKTGGAEGETTIRTSRKQSTKNFNGQTAVYEWFTNNDVNLSDYRVKYNTTKKELTDAFEPNNSLADAAAISLPFNSAPNDLLTEIAPEAADIDFYEFEAEAGQYLIAEVVRGQIDSVMGIFDSSGNLIAFNDDNNGLLSRIEVFLPYTGSYILAITFCCDYDFDGVDPGQGPPLDGGRYVLDVQTFDGLPLPLGDETSINLTDFGFEIPFAGDSFDNIWVNSNGSITFGGSPAGLDYLPSVPAFEAGLPRAAPLWVDLDATGQLVLANTDFATELTITFVDVPEWPGFGANNFSITLFENGEVHFDYGAVTATTGIIGAGEGGGALSTPTDMSSTGGGDIADSPVEEFTGDNPYDLGNPDALTFTP